MDMVKREANRLLWHTIQIKRTVELTYRHLENIVPKIYNNDWKSQIKLTLNWLNMHSIYLSVCVKCCLSNEMMLIITTKKNID